jgi:hypothetical protein
MILPNYNGYLEVLLKFKAKETPYNMDIFKKRNFYVSLYKKINLTPTH